MHHETLAVHAGHAVDSATGAVTLPLHLSTTFERDPDGGFSRGYNYVRDGNPVRDAFERCMCLLEGGSESVAFPSGMAAAFAVLQTFAPGDRIAVAHDVYYGLRELVLDYFPRWGIEAVFVDPNDAAELRRACVAPTKLLWIETPSNPLITVIDIARCASIAHDAGVLLACENTFASPAVQQPFRHGADLVVHSVTKYLAGHSDAMAGVVVVRDAPVAEKLRFFQRACGAVLAPFDAWLALRGIQTLAVRMRRHCENALVVAKFLAAHPAVTRVRYPGLASDPGNAIAARQMNGYGGMLAFELRGGRDEAFAVLAKLKLVIRATSLGGPHTLVEHRASIEGSYSHVPESLLRLSVGIEHADDITADLDEALSA
ncbi:MAG: PLP-dependent transferase [Candidatus Eremiobacteraeota bacterium]|nr:PLP-dependent transferase [Candidatus Eremiobacteraeota bacterium]MBV8374527.1 PLP-dependent transferase [Candidatus Eremiobacteraeota bacterium]